jgi:hypothetical protein
MSIFTSLVTETLDVPGLPGHTVTIRKLAPKHLSAAADVAKANAQREMAQAREVLGDDFVATLLASPPKPAAPATRDDPLTAYDRVTLMRDGVLSWTFDRATDVEAYEDLDDDMQQWLAGAILKLAKPSLYRTVDEEEAAQKNG